MQERFSLNSRNTGLRVVRARPWKGSRPERDDFLWEGRGRQEEFILGFEDYEGRVSFSKFLKETGGCASDVESFRSQDYWTYKQKLSGISYLIAVFRLFWGFWKIIFFAGCVC